MAKATVDVMPRVRVVDHGSLYAERLFYVIAGGLMLIFTAVGFQGFYLHGKGFGGGEMTSQIVPLIVVHGLAMSSWVILFFIQSLLILLGNRRLHMVLGPIGAVIASAIVILGSAAASLSVHFNPELYKPFGGPRFFLAEMWGEMLLFGAFVAAGMKYRSRAEIHRPMMLLATVAIISGSIGRCPYLMNLGLIPPLYVFDLTLGFGTLLFPLQWGMTKRANRYYAIGYASLIVGCLISVVIGNTALWTQMVGSFVP